MCHIEGRYTCFFRTSAASIYVNARPRGGDDSREYRLHLSLTLAERISYRSSNLPSNHELLLSSLLLKAQARLGFGSEVPRLSLSQARSSADQAIPALPSPKRR
jgi:hypothetical protein